MKIAVTILISILTHSSLQAQVKKADTSISDSVKIIPQIDSINMALSGKNDTLKLPFADSVMQDSPQAPKMVYISEKLLDSLLSPFYMLSADTIDNDTIAKSIVFLPRYRMYIDKYTRDTSYISLPKTSGFLDLLTNTSRIDTLKILNHITQLKIKRVEISEIPVWWENENSIGLNLNEVGFINWNAGGSNSISGLLKINLTRTYTRRYTTWTNEVLVRYGLNVQEDKGLTKTDDEIKLGSTFGYRKDTISNWYYSAKFNFQTQFTNGFRYPNTDNPISRLFAPAYLHFGVGTQFKTKSKLFSLYISPITLKSTFVLDKTLSNEGTFGVEGGKKAKHELGALLQGNWEKEIIKNVAMSNTLALYSDYLNKFGNIDIDWVLKFDFKINSYMSASFRTHLIYDDDIKYKEDIDNDGKLEILGARVQLKQQIGIGLIYKFKL